MPIVERLSHRNIYISVCSQLPHHSLDSFFSLDIIHHIFLSLNGVGVDNGTERENSYLWLLLNLSYQLFLSLAYMRNTCALLSGLCDFHSFFAPVGFCKMVSPFLFSMYYPLFCLYLCGVEKVRKSLILSPVLLPNLVIFISFRRSAKRLSISEDYMTSNHSSPFPSPLKRVFIHSF